MSSAAEPTVSSAQMHDVYRELRQRLSPAEIERETGAVESDFQTPDGRLPVPRSLRLWELLAGTTEDPLFALQMGRQLQKTSMGVVANLFLSCATLGEALRLTVRFFSLVNESDRIDFEERDGFLYYNYSCVDPRYYSPYPVDRSLSAAVTWASFFTGKTIQPREVTFQYPAPAHRHQIGDFFGCPVSFEQKQNAVVFLAADQHLPGVHRNDYLKNILETRARDLHAGLGTQSELIPRIKATLVRNLPEGNIDQDFIAGEFNLSRTSLYRKLKESGTSFQTILDEVRRDSSIYYLQELKCSQQETAFLLGYSEASAFHRAYKRWFGESPGRLKHRS